VIGRTIKFARDVWVSTVAAVMMKSGSDIEAHNMRIERVCFALLRAKVEEQTTLFEWPFTLFMITALALTLRHLATPQLITPQTLFGDLPTYLRSPDCLW
jgi:hypothetical protein